MMDVFGDDSDDSSTEEEMKRLWDKLERLQTEAKKEEDALVDSPTPKFDCPSSMSSSSSCSEKDGPTPSPDNKTMTMIDLTNKASNTTEPSNVVDTAKPHTTPTPSSLSIPIEKEFPKWVINLGQNLQAPVLNSSQDKENDDSVVESSSISITKGSPKRLIDLSQNLQTPVLNSSQEKETEDPVVASSSIPITKGSPKRVIDLSQNLQTPVLNSSQDKENKDSLVESVALRPPPQQEAATESSDSSDDSSDDDDSASSSSSSDDSSTSSGSSTSADGSSVTRSQKSDSPRPRKGIESTPKAQNKEPNGSQPTSSTHVGLSKSLVNPYLSRARAKVPQCKQTRRAHVPQESGRTALRNTSRPIQQKSPDQNKSPGPDDCFLYFDKDSDDPSVEEKSRAVQESSSRFCHSKAKEKPTEHRVSVNRPEGPDFSSSEGAAANHVSQDPSFMAKQAASTGSQVREKDTPRPEMNKHEGRRREGFKNDSDEVHAMSQNVSETPIQDRQQLQNEQEPEIHFSLYAPAPYRDRQPPVLHTFGIQNCPLTSRRQTTVGTVFSPPLNLLWQSKFDKFNSLQSELSNALFHTDDHIVVSAPTGAGKTVLFEMAIARFISVDLQNRRVDRNGPQCLSKNRKMVYIAPSKALCEERCDDWSRRLSQLHLGIEVAMITGDVDPAACYHDLTSSHLILTTPEKWDSLTRKWTENFFLLSTVKLFMIDEVHLLGDDSRGCCLESVVSRMKSIQRAARSADVSSFDLQSSRFVPSSIVLSKYREAFESHILALVIQIRHPRQFLRV
jgi:hypothetical protein